MGTGLNEILSQIERYLIPLMEADISGQFSKDENTILVLQQINRLNQRIGQLARASAERMPNMKVLQTQVNNLTIGVKNNNIPQMKNAFIQVKSLIQTLDSESN